MVYSDFCNVVSAAGGGEGSPGPGQAESPKKVGFAIWPSDKPLKGILKDPFALCIFEVIFGFFWKGGFWPQIGASWHRVGTSWAQAGASWPQVGPS